MNAVLIEDTARNNLASWVREALGMSLGQGAVLNPFCSPYIGNTYKPAASSIALQVRRSGGEVWFDSLTHALQMPGVGDFRYYDQWNLWDGTVGDLSTRAFRRDHISRVFDLQVELNASPLAPTVLANSPIGSDVTTAVTMLEDALELMPGAWGTIAGSPAFWASGNNLDALVGTLAQLSPGGWFVTVVRSGEDLPVKASRQEIAGLCRTVRSLSEFSPVHVSFGDFAGLPAIAAGARSTGSGWDPRQRVCHHGSYEERSPATGGGGWFQRPTFKRLLSFLSRTAAERLFAQNQALATHLFDGPLHPAGPKEAFLHHLECLEWAAEQAGTGSHEDRFRSLDALYSEAITNWAQVASEAQTSDESDLLAPLQDGLRSYGADEGWVL